MSGGSNASTGVKPEESIIEHYEVFFELAAQICRQLLKPYDRDMLLGLYPFTEYEKDLALKTKAGVGTGRTVAANVIEGVLVTTNLYAGDSAATFVMAYRDLADFYLAANQTPGESMLGAQRCDYLEEMLTKLISAISNYLTREYGAIKSIHELASSAEAAGGAGGVAPRATLFSVALTAFGLGAPAAKKTTDDDAAAHVVESPELLTMFGSFLTPRLNMLAGHLLLKTWELLNQLNFLHGSLLKLKDAKAKGDNESFEITAESMPNCMNVTMQALKDACSVHQLLNIEVARLSADLDPDMLSMITSMQVIITSLSQEIDKWLAFENTKREGTINPALALLDLDTSISLIALTQERRVSVASSASSDDRVGSAPPRPGAEHSTLRRTSAMYSSTAALAHLADSRSEEASTEITGSAYLKLIRKSLLAFYGNNLHLTSTNATLRSLLKSVILIANSKLHGSHRPEKDFYAVWLENLSTLKQTHCPELFTVISKLGIEINTSPAGIEFRFNNAAISQNIRSLEHETDVLTAGCGFADTVLNHDQRELLVRLNETKAETKARRARGSRPSITWGSDAVRLVGSRLSMADAAAAPAASGGGSSSSAAVTHEGPQ